MASRPVLHLPALLGLGTAAYALSLVFVTSQQAQADARVVAARLPLQRAAARTGWQRSLTAAEIQRAADALERAAEAYGKTMRASQSLDEALAVLARRVQAATGAAAELPDRIQLPAPQVQVVQVAAPAAPAAPAVQATTGGSGG